MLIGRDSNETAAKIAQLIMGGRGAKATIFVANEGPGLKKVEMTLEEVLTLQNAAPLLRAAGAHLRNSYK